ncbi:MAG TPA: hypothetical protein VHE61_01110 [Opitutaceae bacterium]|nr:hypothetical protein [Opitutaceae bacterium]
MSTAPTKLDALRHLLAERFPSVSRSLGTGQAARVLGTGISSVDDAVVGLPLSAITELVCGAPSCGSHLFLGQLLAATRAGHSRVALVDATDSFDPGSFEEDLLAHLVWVRCRTTAEAMHSVDLLARDANFGLVVLDLRRIPEADLRRISAPQWYRLQRAVESTDLALVVETPRSTVPSAQLRLVLDRSLPPAALEQERAALEPQLAVRIQRQRLIAGLAG